jgi:cytochrome P450 family 6
MQIGLMDTKLGVLAILSNFNVEITKDVPDKLDFHPKQFVLTPTVKLNLKFTERSF